MSGGGARRFPSTSLAVGIAALFLCGIGALFDQAQFFRSYLLAFLFWFGIAIGSLALLMLYHLVGGRWGYLLRRPLEAGTRTLPLAALFFVPLLFGLSQLYPWARPAAVAADRVLKLKTPYLNPAFFTLRAALFFGIWILLAFFLNRWSAQQDRAADPSLALKLARLSAPGILIYAATSLFASVDWLMSLDAHWYSSIFGMAFMVSHGLSTMALMIVVFRWLSRRPELAAEATPGLMRDFGNLLFMFVMLWAYMTFSQLIIIWSGNLPEEITWYLPRLHGAWRAISLILLLFYFAAPFALLLSRRVKQNIRALTAVAGAVLVLHLLHLIWVIEPNFSPDHIRIHWMDILAPVGLGGIWISFFLRELAARPILAANDPRVAGAAAHD